jgi:hypothetical protein
VRWIDSRASRVRQSASGLVSLILVSVTLATAVSYWAGQFGALGIVLLVAVALAWLALVALIPEKLWTRVMSDPRALAVDALHQSLVDGQALYRHLVESHPGDEHMREEIDAWRNEVRRTLNQHAAANRADFEAVSRITTTGNYLAADGQPLSRDEEYALALLEHWMGLLAGILEGVRS